MVEVKPGARFRSTTCATEVVVVKAPAGELALECGGAPMVPVDAEGAAAGSPASGADGGTQLGKRYVDADEAIELLCSKAGDGSLSIAGAALTLRGAKPLPSSD
ncbi:MAG TPA: hypothetical protein VJM33_17645 [Microthrixaceae bacterium]|nr:hypothetical protein [Microthrixaceae bacterium]